MDVYNVLAVRRKLILAYVTVLGFRIGPIDNTDRL
jgi:hypothetical protein